MQKTINKSLLLIGGLFFVFSLSSAFSMRFSALSDDQITYWEASRHMAGQPFTAIWKNPGYFFSYVLLGADGLMHDAVRSHLLIYSAVSFLYLVSMFWFLRLFFSRDVSALLSIISIVPHYTLGMTYWGFAGFEFIKARILFMPLLPIVLRLYLDPEKKKVKGAFILAALGSFLSFEAVYLLGILILDHLFGAARKPFDFKAVFKFTAALFLSFLIILGIRYAGNWVSAFSSASFTDPSGLIYERIVPANSGQVAILTSREYTDLLWAAAYSGFWWALFPPKAVDVLFALFNSVILIGFACAGAGLIRKKNPLLWRQCLRFLVIILGVAYLFQLVRYLGWKIFGLPPFILEEPRVFKYTFLPLTIFSGFFLAALIENKKFLKLAVTAFLLLLSPLWLLRALPDSAKHGLQDTAGRLFNSKEYSGYMQKALRSDNAGQVRDTRSIIELLRKGNKKPFFVLTDIHAIKESGAVTIISYQDKRIYGVEKKERSNSLPYWYLAYNEISGALSKGDAGRILSLCKKYDCRYAISRIQLNNSSLRSLYKGENLFLYQVIG